MGYSLTNQTNLFNAMTKFQPFSIEREFTEAIYEQGFSFNASTAGVDIIKNGEVLFTGTFQECQSWLSTITKLRQGFYKQSKRMLKWAGYWSAAGVFFWGVGFNTDETIAKWVLLIIGAFCSLTMLANIAWYFSMKKKLWLDVK